MDMLQSKKTYDRIFKAALRIWEGLRFWGLQWALRKHQKFLACMTFHENNFFLNT